MLRQEGVWDRLVPAAGFQSEAVKSIYADLLHVIDRRFLSDAGERGGDGRLDPADLAFLQDYFFLILFLSVFESLGVARERLPFYAQLDFCIMGTITAADNLFDDQSKSLLPLRTESGPRYGSILQLMCFERLMRRVGDRAASAGLIDREAFGRAQKGLLDQMAEIGRLEGSEEGGVDSIPTPEKMIDLVHRVRGGLLFGLAFVAPCVLETGAVVERMNRAEPAIARLGTAFQIVDDLTDFEFDLGRRSHNLLAARIHHHGTPEQKTKLAALWRGATPEPGLVEGLFATHARQVLDDAKAEARASFQSLAELGFWFPAELADQVVHAIVGLDGVARMESLTTADPA